MSHNEQQADILIVDDQPYSSGESIIEEEEKKEIEEEEKEELVEEANERKKPKKTSEPIFIPVITGTATLESNFAYSDKNINGENSQNDGTQNKTENNKKPSKCCLLV